MVVAQEYKSQTRVRFRLRIPYTRSPRPPPHAAPPALTLTAAYGCYLLNGNV